MHDPIEQRNRFFQLYYCDEHDFQLMWIKRREHVRKKFIHVRLFCFAQWMNLQESFYSDMTGPKVL